MELYYSLALIVHVGSSRIGGTPQIYFAGDSGIPLVRHGESYPWILETNLGTLSGG